MENNEMLDAYLFEADELLENLDDILIECEKKTDFDEESINTIFRTMHTIKGSSAMMEFEGMTTVSHKVEDLFAYVRDNGFDSKHISGMFELLFKASDFLKSELEKIRGGVTLTADVGYLTDEINGFLKKISGAADERKADAESILSSQNNIPLGAFSFKVTFDEEAKMENLRAYMLLNSVLEVCPDVKSIPETPQECSADDIIKSGFILCFNTENEMKKAQAATEQFAFTKQIDILDTNLDEPQIPQPSGEVKQSPDKDTQPAPTQVPQPEKSAEPAKKAASSSSTSLINVKLSKLDNLIDLMGEIVITESMVTSVHDQKSFDYDKFVKASRQLQKLTNELQENIMSIRMVPIGNVFNKMNRIVRDMSKKLLKDVELVIIGEETEVDKTVIDNISDPIMHIVRNAMDHGIEMPQDRSDAGKNPKGRIILKAENTSGEILVTVTDDGKGFDEDRILEKAKQKGMLKKAESEYTKKEIFSLLLMPGFSTKEKVTEFSGRGVGLDVVKNNIEKIGGSVTLTSEKGKGSTVKINIPLTLAIINGMDVTVGDSIFTIPIHSIRQSFKPVKENLLSDASGAEMVMIRNECYPVIRLHEKYGIETDCKDLCDGILMLVESHETSYCIFVDSLIGEQQVVIKPLPAYLNSFGIKDQGISACAILGDGNISLIIDVITFYNNK